MDREDLPTLVAIGTDCLVAILGSIIASAEDGDGGT